MVAVTRVHRHAAERRLVARRRRSSWRGCGSSRRRRSPSASGPRPAATAAAGAAARAARGVVERPRVGGRRPFSGLSVTPLLPNSGVLVLPSRIPPAPRAGASTNTASTSGTCRRRRASRTSCGPLRRGQVLDRDRDAVQRAEVPARALGLRGFPAGLLGPHEAERVEPRLQRLDAVEHGVHQLGRREFARGDPGRQLGRGREAELAHGWRTASRSPAPTGTTVITRGSSRSTSHGELDQLVLVGEGRCRPPAARAAPSVRTRSGQSET